MYNVHVYTYIYSILQSQSECWKLYMYMYVLTCFMHVASQSGFYLGGGEGGWCGHLTPLGTLGGICYLCN